MALDPDVPMEDLQPPEVILPFFVKSHVLNTDLLQTTELEFISHL